MNQIKGILLAGVSVLIWGTMFPIGRLVFSSDMINPLSLALLRFFLGGSLMLIIGCRLKGKALFALSVLDYIWFTILGLLGATLHILLLSYAQKTISSVNASVIEAYVPILIFLLSVLMGNRVSRVQITGLLAGFVGCLLCLKILDGSGLHLSVFSTGDFLIILSALSWAGYIVLGRKSIQKFGGWMFTSWTLFLGGMFIIPCQIFCPELVPMPQSVFQWEILAYFIIFPTIIGFVCWNLAQKYLSLSKLSFMAYLNPMIAAVSGVYIVHESLTISQIVGVILVLGAVLIEKH